MNKIVNIIFVVFGVMFVILLLVVAGLYLSVMFVSSTSGNSKFSSSETSGTSTVADNGTAFTLTDAQKQALVSFGIDPASVPSSISVEQEACFVAELGRERVEEIKAGDTPSTLDFFKAKACI